MEKIVFDQLWNEHIKKLQGTELKTLAQGKTNFIHAVNENSLIRISSTGRKGNPIPKTVFEDVYDKLLKNGSITREQVNLDYPKRYSAIVVAVLERLPMVEAHNIPKVTLKIKR